ncbi:MAG: serine hydrolase [Acidimicrobiia bacterium]|nr:serine hydrolase [Acidimicrobiia bacterium]MYC57076.1 serine hydrolase [Acidimicrobiia bacterium]MYI30153.1 serine hydrolase [Acidimicrobiia bacterium]
MTNSSGIGQTRSASLGVKSLWILCLALVLFVGACGNDNSIDISTTATTQAELRETGANSLESTLTSTSATPTQIATTESSSEITDEPSIPHTKTNDEALPETTPSTGAITSADKDLQGYASGLDIEAIHQVSRDWMVSAGAPGLVVAIAQGDEEPWTFSWGVSDLDTAEPLSTDDYVRIGSVTKPVTTVTVLSLVEDGLLDLDVPITKYLGDNWYNTYEHGAAITLRHLMGHTAGFVDYAFDPGFFVLGSARLDVPIQPHEIVRFATNYGPVADFESEFHYSTAGHVVAGMVIEAATGNPADVEIRSRILDPLGLENTYLPPNELPPTPVVNSYNGGLLYTAFSSLTRVPDEAHHDYLGNQYIATNSYPQEFLQTAGWTGGGMEATIGDVSKMFRGLFAGELINDELLTEMTTPSVELDYGLGVDIQYIADQVAYSHGGTTPAFSTRVIYIPEWDLTLAASANVLPANPNIQELLKQLIPITTQGWDLEQ